MSNFGQCSSMCDGAAAYYAINRAAEKPYKLYKPGGMPGWALVLQTERSKLRLASLVWNFQLFKKKNPQILL